MYLRRDPSFPAHVGLDCGFRIGRMEGCKVPYRPDIRYSRRVLDLLFDRRFIYLRNKSITIAKPRPHSIIPK